MLFLIPLGEERRPVATWALIALNVVVFAWTSRAAVSRATAAEEELERVAAWTVRLAATDAPSLAAMARGAPSTLAVLEKDGRWRQEIRSQDVRERLEACVEDYRRLALEANPGDILTLFLYSPELQQRQLKTVRVEER